jgi:hypothetical protein
MSKLTANNQYKILFNNVLEELKIKIILEHYLSLKQYRQHNIINTIL